MEEKIEILPTDEFILKGEILIPILQYIGNKSAIETGGLFWFLENELKNQKKEQLKKSEENL